MLFFIIGSVMTLIIVVLLNMNYLKEIQLDYKDKINVLTMEYKSKEVKVYQAKEHILAGSILTMDKVLERTVVSDQSSNYYMTSENIGNVTLVDLKEGTWIYKDMLRIETIPDNIREVEYSTFFIGGNINQNDYFDLHIQYPNGEDYIVLSKSLIKRIDQTNHYLYLWLAPEELLNVSGAIVDCYLNQGARLYSVKYIEPTIQKASFLTYMPNVDIINLMKRDPNIVNTAINALEEQVRIELEERIHLFYSEHEDYEVNKQDSIYYPSKSTNTNMGNNTSTDNQKSSKGSKESVTDENITYEDVTYDGVTNDGETKEEEVYYVD
jgi:hypothetical protein